MVTAQDIRDCLDEVESLGSQRRILEIEIEAMSRKYLEAKDKLKELCEEFDYA